MEVAATSTPPVKGVAKAIVAEYLGLDFADKVRPRSGNCLHALYCVSDGTSERCRLITHQQVSVLHRAGHAGGVMCQ